MATDAQFEKLKAMREKRDAPADAPVVGRAPDEINAEQARLEAGEPVGGRAETPEPPEPEPEEPDDAPEIPTDDDTVKVAAHERAKPAPAEKTVAPPGTEGVEIDGKTVYVAPELAAAFREAESAKVVAAKDAETDSLAERVASRLAERLPKPVEKSPAEIAADAALAAAEAEAEKWPMPSAELSISDPAEYGKQLAAHIGEKSDRAAKRAVAEKEAREAATAREAHAQSQAQQEVQVREVLATRFYEQYKVLADPATRKLVDVLLDQKWNEVRARLIANPPKTRADGDAMRQKAFTEVAADATRQIVAIRQQGAAAAPPPVPPTLAQSTQRTAGKPPAPPAERPKEKYPTGSVSAMLAKHQTVKKGAVA